MAAEYAHADLQLQIYEHNIPKFFYLNTAELTLEKIW